MLPSSSLLMLLLSSSLSSSSTSAAFFHFFRTFAKLKLFPMFGFDFSSSLACSTHFHTILSRSSRERGRRERRERALGILRKGEMGEERERGASRCDWQGCSRTVRFWPKLKNRSRHHYKNVKIILDDFFQPCCPVTSITKTFFCIF